MPLNAKDRERGFWGWRDLMPAPEGLVPVTLGEGSTPLVRARGFAPVQLYFKDETRNPTGSHKDRPLALAASHAVARGARVMAVVSAGSTGLSNAAYAARAGLRSVAIMSAGAPDERVAPLAALGARLIEVECSIDEAIAALSQLHGRDGIYVASTTRAANPVQAEAARTIAYEIVADLGAAPDLLIVPVGGGGTIAAIHAGFVQLRALGVITRLPRLVSVVPDRYDTLARAHRLGIASEAEYLALPAPPGGPTILNKIAHDHPPDGIAALAALRDSGGMVLAFSQEVALAAVRRIGAAEGLYLEPSSAIVLPALEHLAAQDILQPGMVVVALACGSGFRETATLLAAGPPARTRTTLGGLHRALVADAD